MANARIYSDGTMANQFRIGKVGPTIMQGSAPPAIANGVAGDIFIQTGATPNMFVRQSATWISISDDSLAYIRQAVVANTTLNANTTYAGISVTIPSTITLPVGVSGKSVTIVDESGNAASNPITVVGQGGTTINGQVSWAIDVNYGSMSVISNGGTGWFVTSAITSSSFNQIKL